MIAAQPPRGFNSSRRVRMTVSFTRSSVTSMGWSPSSTATPFCRATSPAACISLRSR